jgi:hypothetical protein
VAALGKDKKEGIIISNDMKIEREGLNDNKAEEHTVLLTGQFRWGKSAYNLPIKKGVNKLNITIIHGKVRLNHNSYNQDGHFWSAPPEKGQRQHIDLPLGTHELEIKVGEFYGKLDKLLLVNPSFFESAEVIYSVE